MISKEERELFAKFYKEWLALRGNTKIIYSLQWCEINEHGYRKINACSNADEEGQANLYADTRAERVVS